jgi:hypothetical protein
MHMLPKRVADLGGGKWGFAVTYTKYLKIEVEPPTLQTTKESFRLFENRIELFRRMAFGL